MHKRKCNYAVMYSCGHKVHKLHSQTPSVQTTSLYAYGQKVSFPLLFVVVFVVTFKNVALWFFLSKFVVVFTVVIFLRMEPFDFLSKLWSGVKQTKLIVHFGQTGMIPANSISLSLCDFQSTRLDSIWWFWFIKLNVNSFLWSWVFRTVLGVYFC